MSMPRFLADENVEGAIIRSIRRLEPGVEFLTLQEVGLLEASDPVILEYAATQSLIVVSRDVKTMIGFARERIASDKGIAGLFIVRPAALRRAFVESLVLVWAASSAEEWIDQIMFGSSGNRVGTNE